MSSEAGYQTIAESNAQIKMLLTEQNELQDVPGAFQRSVETPLGGRVVVSYLPAKEIISVVEETRGPGSVKIRGRSWNSENPLDESQQLRRILRSEGIKRREIKRAGFRERDIRRISKLLLKFNNPEEADG